MRHHGAADRSGQLFFETQAAHTSHLHSLLFQQLSGNAQLDFSVLSYHESIFNRELFKTVFYSFYELGKSQKSVLKEWSQP